MSATLTPIVLDEPLSLIQRTEHLRILSQVYPEAVAVREFEYMKPGEHYPETAVPCLHVQDGPRVVVFPLDPLSCEVRCDLCREHDLGDLCSCKGTKRRTMTTAGVRSFVDAGDRYGSQGTFWRMAPLGK